MQEDNLSDITLTPRIPTVEDNPFIATAQKMAQPDQLGLNAPEDNPFLAIAKGMGGTSQPPAIGSIASTLSINPDQAAQASKLGGQFGLGQDIALRNMDELRRRSLITRLQQTGMLDKNPALAESLANPAFSAQAHDDIDNLAETGSWIDSIYKGFEGGFLMQEMGELRFSPLSGERFYGATAAQQDRIEQVRKRMQETQGSGVLYMTAQVIAQQLAQAKGIGTAALTGFGIGGATGGAPGAVAGGGVGAATGVVLTTAQMEAGLLYDELEQAGVDPETATTAAVIGGTINGAIELLGAKIAAAPFRPLIRKLIADRVEALAMPTMRSAIRQGVKGYGIQVGTETLEETVQEITAMTASEIAKAADGIDSELTWTDALTRITDAAIGGFQGSLLLGGIGPGANAIVDVRRAKQTEAQQQWLDGLQERVAESKVRERNPNAFQEFVEKQVEGKPVATIYVDAEDAKGVLAQLNLTVSQVDAIVPGFAEQVRTEAERGGDVTIPTAVFSAKLANTDLGNALRPHMRLSPEALSVTQLEAVRAERERMSAAGQDVIDERLAAEDTAFVESATRVEETMYSELTAAGQPATEAKINAEFVRNMMASLADRVGVTPEQMFERYPYRVRGEGQATQAQALEQAVQFTPSGERRTDTPEFKAWNERLQDEGGTNKLTTESGQPMRFYHGTTRGGFGAFDPSFLNTGAGYSRGGFSFVNVRERAEAYAQRGNVDRRILDEKIAMLNKLIADPSVNQQLFRAGVVDTEFFEFEDEPPVVDQFLSNEELEDVIRSYVYDLRRAGNEALASQFNSILDVSEPTSDPEVYEVYLYAGQNVREVDATPETIGQVLAGIDVRNQPGGAIIVNLPDGEKVVYVSDPTNIKSVDNRGTWSRETTDIYKQAAQPTRLMAVHNLSADNLAFAEQMGGLAVPSIGVVTEERGGVEGFGEITLIGTQEMADPATSRVFSSDAYSARFPRAEWPKVSSAKADKFVSQLRDVAKRFGDDRIIDQTFDAMVNSPDAQKVVGYWLRSMPVGALFLSEKGIDIAPIMRERKTLSGLSWEAIDKLRTAYEAVDQQVAYDEMENSTEYRNLQDQYAAAIRAQYESVRDDLGDATIERWATGFTPTTLQRLARDMGQAERQTVDDTATRSAVDAAMEPFIAEFKSWVDTKVRKQFGDPFIRIGRSRKPYTLSNIVDVMTSTKVRGEEKGMTFGAGAARAEAATEFVDLEQMREAAKSAIVEPDEYSKAAKKSDAQLSAYRVPVIEYTTLTDWRGKSDIWAALDGSMRALATYGSRKRRDAAAMRRVLAKEGFASKRMPNELIEQAMDAAEALFNAPVPYFEAKPQRAVRIGEFAGAVIPSNTTQETRDILDRNGVRYMTYLAGDEQDRQRAVREMARSPEAAGQVFFQRPVTPGFYSALEREVGAIDAKALTAAGWGERLKGLVNKGAIKADELEWSGLNDYLKMQEGKVSKDTVLEFMRGNGVRVEVVTLGDRKEMVDQAAIAGSFVAEDDLRKSDEGLSPEVEAAFNTYRTLIETGASREDIAQQMFIINDALDNAFGTDLDEYIASEYEARPETKYDRPDLVLPGGENYREVLLYLPTSPSVRASQQQRYRDMVEAGVPLIEAQELASMSAEDVQQRIFDLQKENEQHAKRVKDFAQLVAPEVEGQTPSGLYEWFLDHQIEEQWRGKVNQLMNVLDDEQRQWVTNRGYVQSLEKFQAINLQIISLRVVYREMASQERGYVSNHWDQLNVLVHLRLIDRIDADGKRVLFVEEVQSDWGQAGVKRGFVNQRAADMAELDNLFAQQEANPTDARKKQIARVRDRIYKNQYNVLRAPFVETTDGWLNLGLKQVLLEAVRGNYDRVAFVNGEQSANRYDLSTQVDSIVYRKTNDGNYDIEAIKDSSVLLTKKAQSPNDLEDAFGKDVAKRIVEGIGEQPADYPAEYKELSGIDLKVGGEGMQDFYDKIVPAAMNKLLKKYGGGKIGAVVLPNMQQQAMEADAERMGMTVSDVLDVAEESEYAQAQPGFDITPAMVEKLATGLPLFQAARGLARGGFDPQKLLTTLNKDADFSTFAHETAHYFLTILGDVAARPDAPASVLDDMNTLLRWFGVKDLATWNAMSLDQQRQYHEQFAYSFETYLFEGKAPSVEMQGLFDQFARWLKQVYQGLITKINDVYKAEFGKDLPILTGEVRQVMDRMLATEDQIARAQAIREMKPQFQTQEQSGMDDATWAAYQELQEQATERAVAELTTATLKEMAWMSRARGRKLRELQRQHDDKRKEIRDEVAEDLRILPVYRAMEFLKRGKVVDVDGTTKPATGQFKLSAAGVQAVMPPGFDVATLGRGRYGMVNEDGLHPDLIAPLYGYASGAELVTALSTAKPFADAVAERTDQRMLSEFSELADPAARSLAVDRAIHNEARARLIAVEQRWSAKLQQPVSVIMEAASQVAGEVIGRQTIRTLSPRAYAAAEARAARLATSAYSEPQSPEQAGQTAATRAYNAAIAAGRTVDEATAESLSAGVAAVETARQRRADFDAKYGGKSPAEVMMRAKRQQLLQNMLARQALEARAEIDRARSAFKRFFGSDEKIAKTRNMEMVSAARAILGWYGFGKRDKSPAEYVDQLRAYNPAAYAQLEPLILRAAKGPQDYRDLTVDEFRVLRDTVDGLWIQARKDKQVKLADRTMALDEVVGELDQRLEEIGVPKVVAGEKRAPTFRDRAARNLMTLRSTMRRVESWADAMDGVSTVRPFTNYLVRPVLDAVDKFTASRNKYMKRFRDLVVNLQMPEGTISAPELDYTFGAGNAGIGKAELLGALLHTGNASNYRKLLLGRGWGQEDEFGNLDDTQFKAFVKRMQDEGVLTKSDYDFLQSVWDLNEDIKPIAQKAHYELYGFYFTEIPASEVVTPFGTYRGGYVPAATDKFMVADAAQRAGEEELESDWRNSLPSTGRGFTQTRMAGYNKALSLDVRVIGAHIDAALRFSMIQPAITQALRILRSREFAARLDRVDPTVKQELLIPWLNRTARQLVSQPGKYKAVDAFWRGVRTRTGMSIMFANLRNAMQQFTGLFPAGVKVQPRYLTAALTEYVGSPQRTANSVAALSPFMEDRLKGQSFEVQEQINEVLLNPSRFDRAQAWTDRHGYFLQQAFQNMVDVVTWVGAYNQSLSTTDTTVTAEDAQREAIAAGDAAVRLTQGSVRPSDVSAFESGTPFFRTLTQFAGYFNMLANLNATEYVKVIRDMGFRGNKGKLVYIYMMGFMLPAVVADAIVRTLGGGWEDEDEDGYLDTFMDWFFGSQIRQGVAFVPFGTSAYTLATTAFDDKPYNDRMTTSPSVASLEAATVGVGKAAIAVVDEEKDVTGKNVRDVLTLLSLATGIPFSVLGRPAGYLVDVQRGEIEPTSTYDMIRGTITGTATPESKR